ncbi:MAG: hypothetical protein ACLSFZ_07290 [Frisingicoccus sp.]
MKVMEKSFVSEADIVVDCVDDIETKVYLEKLIEELKSSSGPWRSGRLVRPGNNDFPETLERFVYAQKKQDVAALMLTVSAVTALQVGEVIKLATGAENCCITE